MAQAYHIQGLHVLTLVLLFLDTKSVEHFIAVCELSRFIIIWQKITKLTQFSYIILST